MKKLYLLRHAKSSWINPFIKDFDRALNDKGLNDAIKVSSFLGEKNSEIDLILTSNAKRALETTNEIKKCVKVKNIIEESQLYNADASRIENLIYNTDDSINNLMIVGHNPGLNLFAYKLLDLTNNIETSSYLEIDLDINNWKNITKGVSNLKLHYIPSEKN